MRRENCRTVSHGVGWTDEADRIMDPQPTAPDQRHVATCQLMRWWAGKDRILREKYGEKGIRWVDGPFIYAPGEGPEEGFESWGCHATYEIVGDGLLVGES